MFIDAPQFPTLRSATDAFFNFAINAFIGSVVIERPLGAYRIHGGNTFTRHPALNNIRGYDDKSDMAPQAARAALDHVLQNFDVFDRRMMPPLQLFRAIKSLNGKTGPKAGGNMASCAWPQCSSAGCSDGTRRRAAG